MYKKIFQTTLLVGCFHTLFNPCEGSSAGSEFYTELRASDVGGLKESHISTVFFLAEEQRLLIRQSLVNALNEASHEFVQIHKASTLISQYDEWYRGIHGRLPEEGHNYWSTEKMKELTTDGVIQYDDDLVERFQSVVIHINTLLLTADGLSRLPASGVSLPEERWIVNTTVVN